MRFLSLPVILLLIIGIAFSSPALFGFTILSDKQSYVPNDTVNLQNIVLYGVDNPAYGANVTIHLYDPNRLSFLNSSCSTDENGICNVNFTLGNELGYWIVNGITELSGNSIMSVILLDIHEEICGDGYCDINEPGNCELDCGKMNGGVCSLDQECYSESCCHGICRDDCPHCGDGYCDSGEICVSDCGEDIDTVIEEMTSSGWGFFVSVGMKIHSETYFQTSQNSILEFEVVVENLVNSTKEGVYLRFEGVSDPNFFPEITDINPLTNQSFVVSIPILSGEDLGNKTIEMIAVSNRSVSNRVDITINVIETEFDSLFNCVLQECEILCCENYVCCEGVCRTSCPYCGDGICSIGENCLCSDCNSCENSEITGNKEEAESKITQAELAIQNAFVYVFQLMIQESKDFLEIAKNNFVIFDYSQSIVMANNSLETTNKTQIYEFLSYGSVVLLFSLFFINKFYKSRNQSRKYGKSISKRKSRR